MNFVKLLAVVILSINVSNSYFVTQTYAGAVTAAAVLSTVKDALIAGGAAVAESSLVVPVVAGACVAGVGYCGYKLGNKIV